MRKSISLLVLCWVITVFGLSTARAANIFWDGTGTSWNAASFWSTAGNATTPDPAAKPGAGDIANFNISTVNSAQTVNLDAAQAALGLVFSSTGTVLIQSGSGVNTLSLGTSGITVNSGAGADTISSAVSLGGAQSWTNNSSNTLSVSGNVSIGSNPLTVGGSGNITFSGSVSTGGASLIMNGNNTLTLSGATDNVSLPVVVNSGVVVLAKTSSGSPDVHAIGGLGLTVSGGTAQLGGTGGDQIYDFGNVTVTSGAFDTNGQNETFDTLKLQRTGIAGGGALVNNAGGLSIITPTNGTVLTGNVAIGVTQAAGSLTLNGVVSGNFALTKVGTGTLTISGANTFSGGLTVANGALQVATLNNVSTNGPLGNNTSITLGTIGQDGNAPGTPVGTIEYTGGTAASTMPFNMPTSDGAIQVDGANTNLTLNGVISGSSEFIKSGPGTLTLGGNNTFSGLLIVNAGTLRVGSASAINPNMVVSIEGPSTFSLSGISVTIRALAAGGTPNNTSFVTQNGSSTPATLTINLPGSNSAAYVGIIQDGGAGTLSLVKSGSGTQSLSGANTYTGFTTVSGGALILDNAGALGTTAGGTTVAGGATLDLGGQAIAAEPLTITGAGVGGNGALVNSGASAASFAGIVTASGPFTVGGTGNITLSGSVNAGNTVLTKIGSGTFTLSGTTDNNSLAMTVNSGTVVLAKTSSPSPNDVHAIGQDILTVNGGTAQLGGTGGDQIYDLGSVTVTSGAFDTNGRNETFATLSLQGAGIAGAGALVNSADTASVLTPSSTSLTGNATIGVTQSGSTLTLNNSISGNFMLTKVGPGTLTLSGANTFTGGVTINAGNLQLGNPGALNSISPNAVNFGAASTGTLSLNGNSITINSLSGNSSTSTIQNGSPTPATLTLNIPSIAGYGGALQDGAGSAPLSLVKNGGGILNIIGGGDESFTGSLTINAGQLEISSGNSLTGGVTINGSGSLYLGGGGGGVSPDVVTFGPGSNGSLVVSVSATIGGLNTDAATVGTPVVQSGSFSSTLTINNASANTYAGVMQDGAGTVLSIAKSGAGTLTLKGINAFTGTTTVNAGTLALGSANALGSTVGGTMVSGGGTLDLAGQAVGAEPLTISGTGVGGNGALINSSNTPASYSGIINGTVNSQSFTVGGSGDINLIGSINGNTLLTKIGNSSLTISGTNDNFGLSANVSSGTLVLAKTSGHTPDVHAIGGNAPLFGMVVGGGTAQLGGTGGDQIYDFADVTVTSGVFDTNGRSEAITTLILQGTGLGGAGALVNSASAASVFTPTSTSLTGNASIGVTQSGGSLTLAGGINGNFTLTKVGPGTLTLSGPGTVACPINVTAGTLIQGGATVTGSVSNFASYVLNSGTFGGPFLTSSGTFTYNAGTFSGRLINAGTVNFNADFTAGNGLENDVSLSIPSGRMITLNGQGLDNEATLTVSGGTFNLSTGANAANINRGTLNLASTTNIHGDLNNNTGGIALTAVGATTIFFDNVVNNGSIITSAGARTVFRGSYSGAGALPGAGVAEFAGDIRPGNSPAILQVGGDALFDSTARSIIEIGGTAPGTQFDQIRVQGQLTLGGTLNVSLINGFAPATGNSFDILDWGTRSGTFSSLQLPALPGGLQWNTSQLTTTGDLSISGSNFAAGDFNRDGHVNAADIPAMLAALTDLNSYKATNSLSDANLLSIGDIDSSGAVTNADVQALLDLLKSGGGSVDAVPEPPSIALMALATLVFAESVGALRSSRHHLASTALAGKRRG